MTSSGTINDINGDGSEVGAVLVLLSLSLDVSLGTGSEADRGGKD